MSLFGGGTTSTPPPPQVAPIDILGVQQAGVAVDQYGYDLSKKLYQFPGLLTAQSAQEKTAYNQLTGPLDPAVQRDFVNTGLGQSLSAFGGGSESPNVTSKGSIGRNTIGASVANQAQGYQDYARSYLNTLLGQSPLLPVGPSGGDLLNLSILNQGNLVNAQQQAKGYQSAVGAANAQASAQKTAGQVQAGTAITTAVLSGLLAGGAT